MLDLAVVSAKTFDVAAMSQAVAAHWARFYQFQADDVEDFRQEFACDVLASPQISALLELPHHRRRSLLDQMARLDGLDFRRRLSRHAMREGTRLDRVDECGGRWTLEQVDPAAGPRARLQQRHLCEDIQMALGALPSAPRHVFESFYLSHMPVTEIARQSQRSVIAVKVSLSNTRAALRTHLAERGWTEADVADVLSLYAKRVPSVVWSAADEDRV